MPAGPRRPGRPQDAGLSERALAAARDLLVERGFAATTIQAVAARSGVHASAIYRRWRSRIELIEEAVFPGLDAVGEPATGDLRADLHRFVTAYLDTFGAPAARAAAAGLIAHHQHATRPARTREEFLHVSARPRFRAVLAAADPADVDPAADPDDVFDMLLSAIVAHTLIPVLADQPDPADRITGQVVRMLRPGAPKR